jgi:hypothetical protein
MRLTLQGLLVLRENSFVLFLHLPHSDVFRLPIAAFFLFLFVSLAALLSKSSLIELSVRYKTGVRKGAERCCSLWSGRLEISLAQLAV